MNNALKNAELSLLNNEVPVGAVLVKNNNIIAEARNCMSLLKNPIKHAEILLVENEIIKIKSKYLNKYDIYVTLQPCDMCLYALRLIRIRRIYFGAYTNSSLQSNITKLNLIKNDNKNKKYIKNDNIDTKNLSKNSNKIEIYGGIMEDKCSNILKKFFKQKRNINIKY
ncbi:nucleoside deaminase [Lyticum sinuosum]|nr:nucleoside deaminase [Lyticum sinuosum]